MDWFQVRRGRLRYRGRVSREPYLDWLRCAEGAATIAAAAAERGYRLLAEARARRGLWKDLDRAARADAMRSALDQEAASFAAALADASYAPGLPRLHVAMHRLVLVPRALAAARARAGVRQRLWHRPELSGVPDSLRAFFCERLLVELDRAIDRAKPTASRPVEGAGGWCCVGADRPYVWADPLWAGAHWTGHLFMYEFPQDGLTRGQRKALDASVATLQRDITGLSRLQRDALLRSAADGLTPARL